MQPTTVLSVLPTPVVTSSTFPEYRNTGILESSNSEARSNGWPVFPGAAPRLHNLSSTIAAGVPIRRALHGAGGAAAMHEPGERVT